jgi:transposase
MSMALSTVAPARRPDARYTDLGSDFYATRINPERRKRGHIRQLEALGYKVTLEPTT